MRIYIYIHVYIYIYIYYVHINIHVHIHIYVHFLIQLFFNKYLKNISIEIVSFQLSIIIFISIVYQNVIYSITICI